MNTMDLYETFNTSFNGSFKNFTLLDIEKYCKINQPINASSCYQYILLLKLFSWKHG